jgi:hypothetical protein
VLSAGWESNKSSEARRKLECSATAMKERIFARLGYIKKRY